MNEPQTKLELTATRIRLWWTCGTLPEFIARSGMDAREASNWAADHRRRGVMLKALVPAPRRKVDEYLTPHEVEYLRRLSEALANGEDLTLEDLTLEVFQQQEPEVVDEEEKDRAERIRLSQEAADRQRARVSQASQWSCVNGDEQ